MSPQSVNGRKKQRHPGALETTILPQVDSLELTVLGQMSQGAQIVLAPRSPRAAKRCEVVKTGGLS